MPERIFAPQTSPLFSLNDAHTARPFVAAVTGPGWRPSRQAPTVPATLNHQHEAYGEQESYGVVSSPTPAPAPCTAPRGAETLKSKTPAARQAANDLAVAELLKISPDPAVLRAYSGTGGMGSLTESLNEFYTPAEVVSAMYAAAGTLKGSEKDPLRVLDLACGTGALLAQAPEGSLVVGVEYEAASAQIAQRLLPHATVHHMPAERYLTRSTDPLFDLCIINPPFGVRQAAHLDPGSRKISTNEHYFVQKAIERVKHGSGLVVALVNLNLAGGANHRVWRHRIATLGQVLTSVTVPTSAFTAAGAGVSTVILVIRRHDVGVAEALGQLSLDELVKVLDEYEIGAPEQPFYSGEMVYRTAQDGSFALTRPHDTARRLSDTSTLGLGRFGQPEYAGPLRADASRLQALRNHTDVLLAARRTLTHNSVMGQVRSFFGPDVQALCARAAGGASAWPIPLGTTSEDGLWLVTPEGWVPNDDFAAPDVADALTVAGAINRLDTASPQALIHSLEKLGAWGRQYREKHGAFNARKLTRLSARVPLLGLLVAHLDPQGHLDVKVKRPLTLDISRDPQVAAGQLADMMLLTEERLMEHTGMGRGEAEALLSANFCWSGLVWVRPETYYAGNAITRSERCRLDAVGESGVRAAALLKQSREFLARIQPATLSEVKLSPRDTTIPLAVIEAWVNARLDSYDAGRPLIAVDRVKGAIKFMLATPQEGKLNLKNRNAVDADAAAKLCKYLNYNTPVGRIDRASELSQDEYAAERALNIDEAREYERALEMHFQGWLPGSGHAEVVMASYNLARRAVLVPKGSTAPLPLADWKGPSGHPFQNMDVRTAAATNGMIFGYAVGLGKTFTGLMLIAYLRDLGQANAPVIVVPAGLIGNWATNAARALPGWKVLCVGMSQVFNADGHPRYKKKRDGSVMFDERGQPVCLWKEDSPAVRRVKLGQIVAGQADLVIMSRETFTAIPMSEASTTRLIAEDDQFNARMEAAETYDEHSRKSRRDVLTRKIEFAASCARRLKGARATDLLFERLGFDVIVYDEAHSYKNLYSPPSVYGGEVPKFLGGGGESNRALDAVFKGRYTRERGGKTYGLTASWLKNSPLEFSGLLNLVTDDLPSFGLATTEALMDQYLRIEPRIISDLEGGVGVKPAVVGFTRQNELRSVRDAKIFVRGAGDPEVMTAGGKQLHSPEVVTREVTFDMAPAQLALYKEYRAQARSAGGKSKGDSHLFSVMWRMRKLTADPALVGLDIGEDNPRFVAFAREALRVRAAGGKTLGFLSIGEKEGSFARLKAVLVKMGYPEHEIEVVSSHSHKGSVRRMDLEDRYGYGDLTLVIGSEVLAEGFNLQRGTAAIIHCDILWNEEGLKQRTGRGARQGNDREFVESIYLLQRGSFDTMTYTIMLGKKAWRAQLDTNADEVENGAASFGDDEIAILMSDNPEATRLAIAEKRGELTERSGRAAQRRRLESIWHAHTAQRYLLSVLATAGARKNGWTANDHLRVNNAKRDFKRHLIELEGEDELPLVRVLHFTGKVMWAYGLPVHEGLCFTLDDVRYKVIGFDTSSVKAAPQGEGATGGVKAFQIRHLAQNAHGYTSEARDDQYVDELMPAVGGAPLIKLSADLKVYVMNGQTTKPAPPGNGALSVLITGNNVETLHNPPADVLKHQFVRGNTVIHYLTREVSGALVIEHVVVLCPNRATTESTAPSQTLPEFHERLRSVAALALSA